MCVKAQGVGMKSAVGIRIEMLFFDLRNVDEVKFYNKLDLGRVWSTLHNKFGVFIFYKSLGASRSKRDGQTVLSFPVGARAHVLYGTKNQGASIKGPLVT